MKCSIQALLKFILLSFELLFFLVGFSPFHDLAQAESEASPKADILFILDGSGSMWGQIEDKAKITIAKEVMTHLIKELPDGINVGLEVYGHRRKGDCNDIEMMVPVGEGDKTTLIKQIQSINPTRARHRLPPP